jgi:hypothetical protein
MKQLKPNLIRRGSADPCRTACTGGSEEWEHQASDAFSDGETSQSRRTSSNMFQDRRDNAKQYQCKINADTVAYTGVEVACYKGNGGCIMTKACAPPISGTPKSLLNFKICYHTLTYPLSTNKPNLTTEPKNRILTQTCMHINLYPVTL